VRILPSSRYLVLRKTDLWVFSIITLLLVLPALPPLDGTAGELGWSFPAAGPLRVHVVRGSSYYTRNYRVDEMLARAGANCVTESTQQQRGISQWGGTSAPDAGWLKGYADPAGHAMDHHVVVVCSVGASGFGKNQQVLVDYVKHGGAVLLLCDSYAFGDRSGKAALAELAPLEFADEGPWTLESQSVNEGAPLKPGPDLGAEELPEVTDDKPPLVYSYYKVKAKPDAKVLLVAGEDDHPILIMHGVGKGRVAVFTATCRGYPKEGQLAYWQWTAWPAFLAKTVQQLAAGTADAPRGLDEKGRAALAEASGRAYDLLDGVNETGRTEFEALLGAAAARCHDKPTAQCVLKLLAEYPLDLPDELTGVLAESLAPWVDKGCGEHVRSMVESGEPGKTILGLILLGAAGLQDATPTLAEFHASGAPRSKGGGEVSFIIGAPQSVEAVMQAEQNAVKIRRAAIMGLGLLGDPAALPLLEKEAAAHAAEGQFGADAEPTELTPEHQAYQNARLASLLCGDAEAAGPVVDFLLANAAVISRASAEGGQQQAALDWQGQLHRRLARAPDSVLPALAKRIAAEENSGVKTAAMVVFGGRELSAEIAKVLSESSVAVVAELGKR
jgi:hypothetical protein